MMRRLVYFLRRVIGTKDTVNAIVSHANQQTSDLIRHGDQALVQLTGHLDARFSSLRDDLPRCVVEDLIQRESHLFDKATERVDRCADSLQQATIPRVAEPEEPTDATPARIAESAPPPLPADLSLLDQLTRWAHSQEEPTLEYLDGFESLSRKGLFVVGNARSGTTILSQCLNLSKEIHILDESNLYVNHSKAHFTTWFNEMHEGTGNLAGKGTFIPEPPVSLRGGLAYLAWLARQYRFVGEKHAFGPHGLFNGAPFQDAFRAFNGRFFYHANYFNIVRTPAESVWSMSKMFPNASIDSLIESWLRSLNLCMDLQAAFPNSYLIFFEDLNAATIDRVSEILQAEILLPPTMLSNSSKLSRLKRGELPDVLAGYHEPLERCEEVYEGLRSMFSAHTLLSENLEGTVWHWLKVLRTQVLELLDSLAKDASQPRHRTAG